MTLSDAVKKEARRLGFSLAGVTIPKPPPHWNALKNWLSMGRHATMAYMEDARRADPRLVFPACRSILVLVLNYPNPRFDPPASQPGTGKIAAYAWGVDYHAVFSERLEMLATSIRNLAGRTFAYRCYSDTGPLVERELAQQAGLGWIGRNTCLIHPRLGSFLLLGEILLDLELEPDPSFTSDRCGSCRRCLEACPTGCLLPDRTMNARRCISFLTIENKVDIPRDLRPSLGDHIFGCDVCQQVCPWNQHSTREFDLVFAPRPGLREGSLAGELELGAEAFNQKFKLNPVLRSKRRGYLRNVAVALGNTGGPGELAALEKACQDDEPLVREHARWAYQQILDRPHTQE